MKASIFISHSCKDAETVPPSGLSPQEAAARSERLRFARDLRDEVFRRLSADARFDVILDVRGGLNPGDVWQDGIHKALATCTGAMILLSPEALASRWVLKEATILSWRVFMGEAVTVVPVMLGVSDSDLADKGFSALNLSAIQSVKVPDPTDAARLSAAAKIAAVFDGVPAAAAPQAPLWQDTAQRWMIELSHHLRSAVPQDLSAQYIREMYRALGMEPNAAGRFASDPFVDIAAHVLTAHPSEVLALLYQAGMPDASQRDELRNKVRPLWVDPNAANPLPYAARKGRVVTIDAESTESARDYVLRAYCTKFRADRVLVPSDVNDGTLDESVAMVEQCLADYLPIEDATQLAADVSQSGPIYVILGPGLVRPDLLDLLTGRYPQLTFVATGGPQWRTRLGGWADKALLLRPELKRSGERSGVQFRNKLQAFVAQRS